MARSPLKIEAKIDTFDFVITQIAYTMNLTKRKKNERANAQRIGLAQGPSQVN